MKRMSCEVRESTISMQKCQRIENYLAMAKRAYDTDNKAKTELYCNKILELDNQNYSAWLLKGKAVGWLSTIARVRIEEAVACFQNALDTVPEDKILEMRLVVANETASVMTALITMCCEKFVRNPSKENADNIIQVTLLIKRLSASLWNKCGAVGMDLLSNVMNIVVRKIIIAASKVYSHNILPSYQNEEYPSKSTWETFINETDAVLSVLELADRVCVDLSDFNAVYLDTAYSSMITIQREQIMSVAYEYNVKSSSWTVLCRFDSDKRQKVREQIRQCHEKWHAIDSYHVVPTAIEIKKQTFIDVNHTERKRKRNNNAQLHFPPIYDKLSVL